MPFVYDDKPYKRVGSTTTTMSQDEYMRLLLDRSHARHRWENQPAEGVRLEDLDHEEILRTRATAIEHRRLSAGTSMEVSDILDRLGLRIDGQPTNAAQMLYGTKFLPRYPQALLKLGRFRGTKVTGDILDNQQLHLHAFAMVREAIAWLDRTLPLAARFPKGSIFREDRQPVPAEALRETIINAVIHRDLSLASGYVAIAVFDNRIEVRSVGELPVGLRAEQLSGEHPSKPRNPDLAGAFHRTGAIEVWGRGTNRVIDACRAWGIDAPTFKVEMGVMTVTFHAEIRPGHGAEQAGTKPSAGTDLVGDPVTDSVGDPVARLLVALERGPLATSQLQTSLGLKHRPTFKENYLKPALAERLIEMTVPDKPSSRLQKYRLTDAGRARLATGRGGAP